MPAGTKIIPKSKRKKGYLKGLQFDEVSLVGKGANQGAMVSLLKMDEEPEEVVKRMFSEILGEFQMREDQQKFIEEACMMNNAFRSSLHSVMYDSEIADKKAALKQNIQQFVSALTTMIDNTDVIKGLEEIAKAATKTEGGKSFPASDYAYVPDPSKPSTWKLRLTSTPGGDPDPAIVGAAAAALGPGYRGQKVQLPGAVVNSVKSKVRRAWRKANPDKDPGQMPQGIKKEQEELEMWKTIEFFKALADLNDESKAFFKGLDEGEQEKLFKADPTLANIEEAMMAGKKKKAAPKKPGMKKSADDDGESFVNSDGVTISKEDVGDVAYVILKAQEEKFKAQAEEITTLKKTAENERELRINKELAEEAEKIWPNLPGAPMMKGQVLKSIRKMDEGIQKDVLGMIEAGNIACGNLFKENGGKGDPVVKSAEEQLNKMATDYAKEHNTTFHKAYSDVCETPEGKALYEKTLTH